MFWVISPRFDVRFLNRTRGQQRFLACSLASAGVEEEPDQKRGSGRQQHRHQHGVAVGLENPEHDEEHADRGQDRSEPVEGTGRVGREGVGDPAAEQDDQRDDRAWKMNAARQLIAVVMRPPISGPAAAPRPPSPLMTPNARAREVRSLKRRVVRM